MRPLPSKTIILGALLGATLVGAVAPLSGCRGDRTDARPHRFLPDMDKQPKWKPQSETEFFYAQDGSMRTQRVPDANAVAFGRRSFDPALYADAPWAREYLAERDSFLAEDERVYRGVDGAPDAFLNTIPIPVTEDLLALGRKQFEINCVACHGYLGDGQGMVAVVGQMTPAPANLHDPKYTDPAQRTSKDGYIFDVIRNGLWNEITGANRMPAYGHNINTEEAWAIVAYVRVLQASQSTPITSSVVPETTRAQLMRTKPAPPAPAPDATEPATDGGQS